MTHRARLSAFAIAALTGACGATPSPTPSPPTGLRAALLQPADIPGHPAGRGELALPNLLCVAPVEGAVEQVSVDYPIGTQTGPQPGVVLNVVIRFGSGSAEAFMTAEKAQFDTCTGMHPPLQGPPPEQPAPPQAGDTALRHVYVDCDRFGCVTEDYLFIRKGSLVSVIVNFASVLGTLDPQLSEQLALRAAAHLAAVAP